MHGKVQVAGIPGGCIGLIQSADVSWNRPFKSKIRELYDDWLENGTHTYTKQGNMRAVSKNDLCDIAAYNRERLILNRFGNLVRPIMGSGFYFGFYGSFRNNYNPQFFVGTGI